MRILDLGCGTGTNLAKLGVTESDEVTGVDIDDKVLAIARHRLPRRAFSSVRERSCPSTTRASTE
jgi:ubiquinone/menaquinone biosynthesis C-methylase UbiE